MRKDEFTQKMKETKKNTKKKIKKKTTMALPSSLVRTISLEKLPISLWLWWGVLFPRTKQIPKSEKEKKRVEIIFKLSVGGEEEQSINRGEKEKAENYHRR